MALEIPRRYVPAMIKIRRLSDAAADELIKALESSSIVSDPGEMATSIAEHVPSIPVDDLVPIIEAVYSIYYVREFSEMGRRTFLRELFDGIRESPIAELAVPANEVEQIQGRLERLLSLKNLNKLSKAIKLQRSGERLYCDATVFSDIRPVFGGDVESKPEAAVVTHTLKIGYHEDGRHREFFVVLDRDDLNKLGTVIERARAKAKTIGTLLDESKIPKLGM